MAAIDAQPRASASTHVLVVSPRDEIIDWAAQLLGQDNSLRFETERDLAAVRERAEP